MIKYKDRPTIALLVDWTADPYYLNIFNGVRVFCEKKDLNLLCLEGADFREDTPWTQHNSIYNFANKSNVDGAVILTVRIAGGCNHERISKFTQQINNHIPCVSIGYVIEGIPSIIIDNSTGFKLLLKHLIVDHNLKRLCFIKGIEGNLDAEERYTVYKQALEEHKIPFRDELVVNGMFMPEDGVNAVKVLLDDRKLSFDAIVAANDYMAIGVIRELSKRGYHIPEDIVVTGFDNIDETIYLSPPLTTVAQPIYKLGYNAAEIIFNKISGENSEIKDIITLPTHTVIRDSCGVGCSSSKILVPCKKKGNKISSDASSLSESDKDDLNNQKNNFLSNCRKHISEEIPEVILENLYDTFITQLSSKDQIISTKLILKSIQKICHEHYVNFPFNFLIDCIRDSFLKIVQDPYIRLKVETLCNIGLIHFGHSIIQKIKYQNDTTLGLQRNLYDLHSRLFTNLNISYQINILTSYLSKLGIERCVIIHSENIEDIGIRGETVLRYDKDSNSTKLYSDKITIENANIKQVLPSDKRYIAIVEAVYNYGIMITNNVEIGCERIYRDLREMISVAFNSSKLFNKLENQKNILNKNISVLRQTMEGFIKAMANILESRDPYTAGHQRRVSDLARSIATEMDCTEDQINTVRMAAIIHDIGKICVPAEILNKPGALRDAEFLLIKFHPEVAYDILKNIDFPWPLAEVVYQHHEKLNGSGYPRGLKEDEILLEAKILCVADVVEAMASHRPYRPALGIQAALDEINKLKGINFEPKVVDACLALFDKGYSFKISIKS